MWLFGQLDTVGESKVQQQTDENAKVVAELLKQLLERQRPAKEEQVDGGSPAAVDEAMPNGSSPA